MRDAIEMELREEVDDPRNKAQKIRKLRLVARALVQAACDGDIAAAREINDRVDGKVPQALTGVDDGPVQVMVVRFNSEDGGQ
jgi:hypothetical protein